MNIYIVLMLHLLYKGKGTDISIVPHSQKLSTEALRYGSHSFYAANTPYMPDGTTTE